MANTQMGTVNVMIIKTFISLAIIPTILVVVPKTKFVYSECELAVELVLKGMNRRQINDWVCLVEFESSRNVEAIGGPNIDGSFDFGLFQISENYWCTTRGPPGQACNSRCSDFTNSDIRDDIECAKKIYYQHGFGAWYGWTIKCNNSDIPNLDKCF